MTAIPTIHGLILGRGPGTRSVDIGILCPLVYLFSILLFLMTIAKAFFVPTSLTRFFPLVTPV